MLIPCAASQHTPRQALHIEQVCLAVVPPPLAALAAAPAAPLRELRLHCCQIQRLGEDIIGKLTGLTNLQLSGECDFKFNTALR